MFLFHEIILFILLQSLKMHLSSTFNFAIYLFHTMVKCLKEILKQPKLVFKNPVNYTCLEQSRQFKLDKLV